MTGGRWREHAPLLATVLVCVALYVTCGVLYEGFFSLNVLGGFLADNACLGIVAVGMTFVILAGGIDLSVGAMVGCTSIAVACLVELAGWHPVPAALLVIALGTGFGAATGAVIHLAALPPFLVTLATMFLLRGLGFVFHEEAITIEHGFFTTLADLPRAAAARLPVPENAATTLGRLASTPGVTFLLVLGAALYLGRWTRFGRNAYALGGSEHAAALLGLPVGRTKVQLYAFSGFCGALAGVVYALYTFSGNANAGTMLELDAIAAVVIGGTLLTGGIGHVAGTLFGVLICGMIQTAIIFDGRLSSWWTRIAIGALLLLFVLLQRGLQRTLLARRAGSAVA